MDVRVSTPALLTMMSTRPNSFTAAANRFCSSASWLTSAFTPMAQSPSAWTCLFQFFRRFGMRDVINDDVRALPREFQHDGQADAAVAAGDDGDFAFETHNFLLGYDVDG